MTEPPPAWAPPTPSPEAPGPAYGGTDQPTVRPAAPDPTSVTNDGPAAAVPAEPGLAYPTPAYPPAYPAPAYPAPAYPGGYAPGYDVGGYAAGYGAAGYGGYPGGYAYPLAKRTNPMAIASMTTSIVGLPLLLCYGLGLPVSVVGAILGHVAKRQIKERDEGGDGLAMAGIIMGWIGTGLAVLGIGALIVLITFAVQSTPTS